MVKIQWMPLSCHLPKGWPHSHLNTLLLVDPPCDHTFYWLPFYLLLSWFPFPLPMSSDVAMSWNWLLNSLFQVRSEFTLFLCFRYSVLGDVTQIQLCSSGLSLGGPVHLHSSKNIWYSSSLIEEQNTQNTTLDLENWLSSVLYPGYWQFCFQSIYFPVSLVLSPYSKEHQCLSASGWQPGPPNFSHACFLTLLLCLLHAAIRVILNL